jgi:hypothetical protein
MGMGRRDLGTVWTGYKRGVWRGWEWGFLMCFNGLLTMDETETMIPTSESLAWHSYCDFSDCIIASF